MSDSTPTTAQVRAHYAESVAFADGTPDHTPARDAFDRWLAATIRQAKAEALVLASDHASDVVMAVLNAADNRDSYHDVEGLIKDYLLERAARHRADKINKGDA